MPELTQPEKSTFDTKPITPKATSFFHDSLRYKQGLPQGDNLLLNKMQAKKTETTKIAAPLKLGTDTVVGKPALSLDEYQQPALVTLTNALIASIKIAIYGPRVTEGSISAIRQLQQLARIYGSTISKPYEREILQREVFKAYLGIIFTAFLKGFKKGDYKYNSASAYQSYIEKFVRKLI